jgi:regulator of replication initiation timing
MANKNPFKTPRIIRPGDRSAYPYLWLPLLLLWLFSTWQSFDYGRERAGFDSGQAAESLEKVRGELRILWRERDQLKRQIASLEDEQKVHKVVQEEMQKTLRQQQTERLALEKKLLFLRGAKNTDLDQTLLQVRDLKTWKDKATGLYHLTFTISQAMTTQPSVKGEIKVVLKGADEKQQVKQLPFAEIAQGELSTGLDLEQFQKIDWNYRLPEGFEPAHWEVHLKAESDKVKDYRENFPWKTSE